MKRLAVALLTLAALNASSQTVELPPVSATARIIRALVAEAPADLRDTYAPSGYQPLWTRDGVATAQADAIIALLANAGAKGLDARDYDAADLALRQAAVTTDAARAEFDVALTDALFRYVNDVSRGRVAPDAAGFEFDPQVKTFYFPALATAASVSDAPATLIATVEPPHVEYRALLDALAHYRELAAHESTATTLAPVARVAPGDAYEGLADLAARLRTLGDLPEDATVGSTYEGAIVDAVRSFQARHGLDPDGILGRATIQQLNVPLPRRVEQIRLALERWRWVSRPDGDVILINVPSYRLTARGADDSSLSMRVVVGRSGGHRTPMFDGTMKNVVFRPYWGVTSNIQKNELVPKIERDRTYLARNGYELVDGGIAIGSEVTDERLARLRTGSLRVRQKPGRGNALGLVKFLFPNDNNVYLHSTPQPELFSRARRDFSHGCIRVEDPTALATWILRDQQWSAQQVNAAMNGNRDDVYVKVTRPVRVVLMYATASASNGKVEFFDDIYRHDAQLAAMLAPKVDGGVMVAAR